MASRFARSALGAPSLRPALAGRSLVPAFSVVRPASSDKTPPQVPAEDPKTKAQALIDALPGSSFLSKTAILSSAGGLSVYAISNEYYVVNEESVIAFCLLSVWAGLVKFGGPMYKQYAETQNNRIRAILQEAREDHKVAVKSRIDDVTKMDSVVDVTKALFEVSKETARLEAQAYELEQKTAVAAEAKAVLDSWVRYENQMKQRQQKEVAENVIARARKELENPRVLQQILQQSVADVERIVSSKAQ